MLSAEKVEQALDAICMQGCSYTDHCIKTLLTENECFESSQLNRQERKTLLAELRSIMSIYHLSE